jgi:hypothetical protein
MSDTTVSVKVLVLSNEIFEEDQMELRIYPNPATDRIFIESAMDIQSVEILDLRGSQMLLKEADLLQRNLELSLILPQGIYLVKVRTEKAAYTRRIMISR